MKSIWAVACVVAMLAGCNKTTNPISTSNSVHEVLLQATANAFETSQVTYNNGGTTGGPVGFTGNWAMYISCPAGIRISLTVTGSNTIPVVGNPPPPGSLTATITVDGTIWKTDGSAGQSASATVGGVVP